MMTPTHRVWGAWHGVALGMILNQPLPVSLGWAGLGYLFANLPDTLEKPLHLKHRTLTHYPEFPLALMWATSVYLAGFEWILAMGMLNTWFSHTTGDFIFGKAGYGRGPGVPTVVGYLGLGFKVDSKFEHVFRICLQVTFPLFVLFALAVSQDWIYVDLTVPLTMP